MDTGLLFAVIAVAAALALGAWRLRTDGRFGPGRGRVEVPHPPEAGPWAAIAAAVPGARMGERATLVQFSSAFCAPCRVTRRVLGDVAGSVPGVVHLEIDAEQHLDLVRRVGVLRTPTTLVLDATGVEVARAAGAPRREQVLGAVSSVG